MDLNRNGRFEAGEPGVAGVGVSNGHDVVATDRNGHYSLAIADGEAVFVIKPAGYRLPVDARNLPRFFYLHKPDGSPRLQYAGLAPTGPLPAAIDFALEPGEPGDRFSILVLADPQPGVQQELEYFDRDVVAELAGRKEFRFGITLGDLVFGTLSLFDPLANVMAKVGIPWFNVIGNHDLNMDAVTQADSEASFDRTFGPATYAFNEGQVHFIVLNCLIHPSAGDARYYAGGLTAKEFAFVENDLKLVPKDRLVAVAMHYPLVEIPGRPDEFPAAPRRRLFQLLEQYPHTLSLSGHTHFQSRWLAGPTQGWQGSEPHPHYNIGTASGDWWNGALDAAGIPDATMIDGTPNGYATIQFDGVKFQVDYKAARAPADYRMSVTVLPGEGATGGWLYVNYFLGGEGTNVVFRVDDGEWQPAGRASEVDPAFRLKRKAWREASPGRRRNEPTYGRPSTHLWKAALTAAQSSGPHRVEVRVTDADGRVFSSATPYGAAAPAPDAGVGHN